MRTAKSSKLLMAYLLLGVFSVSTVQAGERLALVIGNGDYQHSSLRNAVNDAADVATKLRSLGFKVTLKKNLNRKGLFNAFRQFSQQVKANTEIALIFYSGHGAQFEKQSYLIPLRADINTDDDLPVEAINARNMLKKIENRRAKVNVMILDACRDLPFTMASTTKSTTRGLASINSSHNTLIAYATASGKTALDAGDNGRNSPYTEILLKYLDEPNTTLTQMFNDIGYAVKQKYGQTPWLNNSSLPRIYLNREHTQQVTDVQSATISPAEIARKLQVQLNRLQCNAGNIDGQWSNDSRAALQRLFDANSQLKNYGTQPNEALLQAIQNSNLQSCANFATTTSNQNNANSQSGSKRIDHYIVYNNGTAKDTKTGLIWQRCSYGQTWHGSGCSGKPKKMTWDEAMKLNKKVNKNGWRVPTIDELETIVYCSSGQPKGTYPGRLNENCEGNYRKPTINTTVFPNTPRWSYWSASPYSAYANNAWNVGFYGGHSYGSRRYFDLHVRLVRFGQ